MDQKFGCHTICVTAKKLNDTLTRIPFPEIFPAKRPGCTDSPDTDYIPVLPAALAALSFRQILPGYQYETPVPYSPYFSRYPGFSHCSRYPGSGSRPA